MHIHLFKPYLTHVTIKRMYIEWLTRKILEDFTTNLRAQYLIYNDILLRFCHQYVTPVHGFLWRVIYHPLTHVKFGFNLRCYQRVDEYS